MLAARVWLSVAFLLPALPALALDTVSEIRQCVKANSPKKTSSQEIRLVTVDRTGFEQTLEAESLWKRFPKDRSRVLVRVERPLNLRGSAYLLIEREGGEDMFTYLPELGKVRRINARTISGSLFGTDFSYEDVAYLRDLGEADAERKPDSSIAGRPVYVLAGNARLGDDSAYDRVVVSIDQETCVILKVEFFVGDEAQKVLLADPASLMKQDGVWIPIKTEIKDVRAGTVTRLEVEKIEFDLDIPDSRFSQSRLEGH